MSNKDFKKEMVNIQEQIEQTGKSEADIASEQVEPKEEKKDSTLFEVMEKEGGPAKEQIDEWKENFNGKVYATYFDEHDFYIYRYLTRIEYKQLNADFGKIPQNNRTDELWDEMVVQKCLLFPMYSPDLKATVGAGTFETIRKQIMINSNFIPDELAIRMIQKL